MPTNTQTTLSKPISEEAGAAIAKPIGLKINEPSASNEETLDKASLGTLRCRAVYQSVPQRSKVIPKRKAQKAMKSSDCGLARENI